MTSKKEFIDPWSSDIPEDYLETIKKFGLEKFNVKDFPNPNIHMRRATVVAGRDLKIIIKAIKEKKKYYALTGFMPSSSKLHLGNKVTVDNMVYFQNQNAKTYILIADLESNATRKISYEQAKKSALEYFIPTYIALGIDHKKTFFYFQSENKKVTKLMFELSSRATLNEYRSIYGNTEPNRIISSLLQTADILFPQVHEEKMPGIIPVGIDQDPHIRLSRDIARREGENKFFLPSAIEHKFTPALDGSLKMSKSKANAIELPDTDENIETSVRKALTGGRETAEIQRKKGGFPDKCMVFELYKQHLIEDDNELNAIYKDCKTGKILCGSCKQNCIDHLKKFMRDFKEKFEQAKKQVHSIKFIED